jgi:ribosomal protein S18 acetylase RimI-like enzyme
MAAEYAIRTAVLADLPALDVALAYALDWRGEGGWDSAAELIAATGHGYLLAGWGRAGDAAVVAVRDTETVGAAWYRFWDDALHSYGYIDESTPEVGVGVAPGERGRGVGTALLKELIAVAAERGIATLSLSVERDNPASGLYRKLGFAHHADFDNAWTMRLALGEASAVRQIPRPGLSNARDEIASSIDMADLDDVKAVLALARACVADLRCRGILQWDEIYPDARSIERDIAAGRALVARDGEELVAYVTCDERQEPEYAAVAWQIDREPVAVVHRLMVSPAWQGRGLGRRLMRVVKEQAAEAGAACMHLDAFSANPAALALYASLGYRVAGSVRFRTGEFTCFERAT